MYVYMYVGLHVFMHACRPIHISKKIKAKIFYSHKTVTLMNMINSNTVICKNKTTKRENPAKNGQPKFK